MFSKKKPKIDPDKVLASKPVRTVDAQMQVDEKGDGRLTVEVKPKAAGRWFFRLPDSTRKTFEFDPIGVYVWELIDGKSNVRQIIRAVADRYNLNLREAEVPTLKFLQVLMSRGLVGIPMEKES